MLLKIQDAVWYVHHLNVIKLSQTQELSQAASDSFGALAEAVGAAFDPEIGIYVITDNTFYQKGKRRAKSPVLKTQDRRPRGPSARLGERELFEVVDRGVASTIVGCADLERYTHSSRESLRVLFYKYEGVYEFGPPSARVRITRTFREPEDPAAVSTAPIPDPACVREDARRAV